MYMPRWSNLSDMVDFSVVCMKILILQFNYISYIHNIIIKATVEKQQKRKKTYRHILMCCKLYVIDPFICI